MESVRSLRELFASMSHGSSDPAVALAAGGHGELPGHLVTEAICNYADTAPVEVAEHLSPFVVANSAVPAPDGHPYPAAETPDGLSLLSSAPDPVHTDHPGDDPFAGHHDVGDHHFALDDVSHDTATAHDDAHTLEHGADHGFGHEGGHHADLWFGHGQAEALHLAGTDGPADAADQHFAGGEQHGTPWLDVHDDPTAAHPSVDAYLWPTDVDLHEPHDAGHGVAPVEEPQHHDAPLDDPGHHA